MDVKIYQIFKNWNISKCENISYLFHECKKLSDISPLKNWNVSNIKDLKSLFSGCQNLSDISPLKNWNISKCENISIYLMVVKNCLIFHLLKIGMYQK